MTKFHHGKVCFRIMLIIIRFKQATTHVNYEQLLRLWNMIFFLLGIVLDKQI